MKERPILFSASMVRAILDGRKAQTRRVVKPQPGKVTPAGRPLFFQHGGTGRRIIPNCPYGQPGDRLWVKETFWAYGRWETRFSKKKGRDEWHFIDMTRECDRSYQYAADNPDVPAAHDRSGVNPGWWKRSPLFMPRHVSRIMLEITDVRVERLNDISEQDALEEGITYNDIPNNGLDPMRARTWFRGLWESINGGGSWDKNPWVWVIELKRVDGGAA